MRLLIIEDELNTAQALARGLRQQGYAVDIAVDGNQGWELATVHDYDLLILDLNLPGMDGLTICQRLRATQSQTLVLMLTARDQLKDRVIGLDMGADDYLVKPFHFEELLARIRALLRRDLRIHEPILQNGALKLDPASNSVWLKNRLLTLTRKEFAILEYLMRHLGKVVSQETLMEHVWDQEMNPFSNTVRVHIASLRRKLDDDLDSPRFIETVIGKGYRLLAQQDEI